ncbi:DsrE family protein [Sulfitobacter pontiacus]|jgi:intracellular sulfur oxidation DsrE/DsrF family protein|uniref:DsrE family protein n=1 Tax=Sulfitobacter pontiacus TaxID=60137 RepID=UPI0030EF65E5|tara:strand:- start:6406 stop:6837 length:432 start_codon:yes stop_codon:yes gene_type:complete
MKTILAASLIALSAGMAFAEGVMHRVAIHVDENDPKVMNMALNNAANVAAYYESVGDEVTIELVAYGPGLNMFISGKSPVEQRISTMSLEMENLSFAACGNTHRKMSEKAGKEIPLIDEANMVPSGVVRLIQLQEEGFAYVRP